MTKKKVLIIDDESEMRKLLRICIKPTSKFTIDTASSGKKAMKMVTETKHDLILLDIMMPGMSGLEILHQLRKKEKNQVPVILISALGDKERIVEGINLGADDYVVKPFEPKDLQKCILSVLRRRTSVREDVILFPDGLKISIEKQHVTYQNQQIPLTNKEFVVFKRMSQYPGQVYTKELLAQLELSGESESINIDSYIRNIRTKLKDSGFETNVIKKVDEIGYQVINEDIECN
ncbi:response regulator transcription factor [Bacillus sp. FJAT-44742]|uniref:response regulator transcription factor n=1 Tax=Bacillus sp. FJAT-44742 TaxID=2014005 RepID=UPI000C237463|nr:response regulator transcription factor [Bacillus sp. FJAT-44742]